MKGPLWTKISKSTKKEVEKRRPQSARPYLHNKVVEVHDKSRATDFRITNFTNMWNTPFSISTQQQQRHKKEIELAKGIQHPRPMYIFIFYLFLNRDTWVNGTFEQPLPFMRINSHATSSPELESQPTSELQLEDVDENENNNENNNYENKVINRPQPPSSKPNRNNRFVRPSTAKEKTKDEFIPGNMEWNCQYRFKKVDEKNTKPQTKEEQKQNLMENIIAESYEISKDDFTKKCFNECIPDTVIPNNQRVVIRSPCVPIDLNNSKNYLCLYDEKEHLWETIV